MFSRKATKWLVLNTQKRRCISTKRAGNIFANAQQAEFLASAASTASIPDLLGLPEIVVTGRANVGKSSLLNAVTGRPNLLRKGKRAGLTQALNFYNVGTPPNQLVLVDSPGYGSRGRPEWGALFDHYINNRKQLRRIYILLNAEHGLTEADVGMLESLDSQCQSSSGVQWTYQAVITKADQLTRLENGAKLITDLLKDVHDVAPMCLPGIITTAHAPFVGVSQMKQSIAEACGIGFTKITTQ